MATVDTEGKWVWLLTLQYAYITTKEYIKLGCSLGAVQTRSSMRRIKLALRNAWQIALIYTSCWWFSSSSSSSSSSQSTVEEHLHQIISEIADIAQISHGQSISTKVLSVFREQAVLVAAAPTKHQVVFAMAKTDAALADMKLRGAPAYVTYFEAITLTNLLSETLAWEWYWLTHATPRSTMNDATAGNTGHLKTRSHTLAMMLNNSPEFNLIWMAVSEASIWMTFLDSLYSTEMCKLGGVKSPVAYHHCSTALLNTNIPNHNMLCHSLECAAAELLIMEERFLPLLFDVDDDDNNNDDNGGVQKVDDRSHRRKRSVKLPECVRRVFVWRGTSTNSLASGSGVQPWMSLRVQRFNEERGNSDTHDTVLDLFGLISRHYPSPPQRQQQQQQQCQCTRQFQVLMERILWFPPDVLEFPFEQQWRVSSVRNITKEALLLFRPVMPVLHIYTSGTTGLPKAARFSHLRFFATIFLSSMLPMRRKLREILVKKSGSGEKKMMEGAGVWRQLKNALFSCQPSFAGELNVLTVYNCLPMYHTVGCVFCMAHLLRALQEQQNASSSGRWKLWGGTGMGDKEAVRNLTESSLQNRSFLGPTARMIIRSKFSASRFTSDLQYYRVTVVQYIGEILRYALQHEKQDRLADLVVRTGGEACVGVDVDNTRTCNDGGARSWEWNVPFAFGNGLRSDIWCECKEALGVSQVVEFYSSTEGNVFLINLFDIPGVVGHLPLFPAPLYRLSTQFNPLFPFRVVRYDFERDEVWRHPSNRRCAHCSVGETGEVLGEIIRGYDMFGLRRFDGYHSNVETQRNIIQGVFKKNDAYFLSGDLVKFDAMGFATFVDRVGETFRWKGENVSTTEVMNALSGITGQRVAVQEVVVYGVHIPGREGRAGMAKLTLRRVPGRYLHSLGGALLPTTLEEERLFLQNEFYGLLSGAGHTPAVLPGYAIPMCIRIDDDDDDDDDDGAVRGCEREKSGLRQSPDGGEPFRPPAAQSADNNDTVHTPAPTTTTTTFKYRRHVLARAGFQYALSSGESAASRVYVLVTKRGLLVSAGTNPISPLLSCGYVPLNSKTAMLLGEELQNCGW